MEIILVGKAREVFREMEEMTVTVMKGETFVVYEGHRRPDGTSFVIRTEIKEVDTLDRPACSVLAMPFDPAESLKLYNHAPDFEWGHLGSSAAQLALAIVLDATGDKVKALKYHEEFKIQFVSMWQSSWRINADQVRRWLDMQEVLDDTLENIDRRMAGEDKKS